MRILIRYDSTMRSEGQTQDELAKDAFRIIQEAYGEQARLSDSYLKEIQEGNQSPSEYTELVDGVMNPETIREAAENWNRKLEENLTRAVSDALVSMESKQDGPILPWFTLPSLCRYELAKAAMAVDGQFHDYAEYAVLVDEKDRKSVV